MKKMPRLTDLLVVGAITLPLMACAPKRVDLYEAEMYKGKAIDFTNTYVEREGALDAAETSREGDALKDMIGIQYANKSAYLADLDNRVGKERAMDIFLYGTAAVVVDGVKLYSIFGGGNKSNNNNNTNPPVTQEIGGGTPQEKVIDGVTKAIKLYE